METRVILACGDKEATQAYVERIRRSGIEVDAVSSLAELHHQLLETSYNGILLDVRTKIRASGREKEIIHSLLEVFPVLQVNLDKATGAISALFFGQCEGEGTIEDFLHRECISFTPRRIRADLRKNVNLNVRLSEKEGYSETDAVRSVTLNVSKGGCFIYSTREWDLQSSVWFTIHELSDPRPIIGEVRWQIAWGKTLTIPGIGIRFVDIQEEQLRSLCDRFNL